MKYLQKRILQASMLASGLLLLNACGGGGGSTSTTSDTNTTTPDATSITHNGTTYGFVTSPHTGKVWLDKNLGAARVCEQFDDSACYGDYYQWGRNFDGHQDGGSSVLTARAGDVNNAGINFIVGSSDWTGTDINGNIRNTNWSKSDGSSVCPVGFRVPNITELESETLANGVINSSTAFSNFLKLPSAGSRSFNSGSMLNQGSRGRVWASSVNGANSHFAHFDSSGAYTGYNDRARGFTVRCLRD